MKRLIFIGFTLMVVGLVGSAGTSPVLANASTTTTNLKLPLNITLGVPCANGGAGEAVDSTGYIRQVFHVTVDDGGGYHSKFHQNVQGVRGTGQTTGDKYQGTRGVNIVENSGKVGVTNTFVDSFRLIGPGPGNNLLVHQNIHFTVNANGEVMADVDNFRATCK